MYIGRIIALFIILFLNFYSIKSFKKVAPFYEQPDDSLNAWIQFITFIMDFFILIIIIILYW